MVVIKMMTVIRDVLEKVHLKLSTLWWVCELGRGGSGWMQRFLLHRLMNLCRMIASEVGYDTKQIRKIIRGRRNQSCILYVFGSVRQKRKRALYRVQSNYKAQKADETRISVKQKHC